MQTPTKTVKILLKTTDSFLWEISDYTIDLTKTLEQLELMVNPPLYAGKTQNRNVGFYSNITSGYVYSGGFMKAAELVGDLDLLVKTVNWSLGTNYNSLLINKYKDGNDYVGSHADDEKNLVKGSSIATLSYGASRIFRIRSGKDNLSVDILKGQIYESTIFKDKALVYDVITQTGTLLVMDGKFQSEFKHEIPKSKVFKNFRYSITFREHLPSKK